MKRQMKTLYRVIYPHIAGITFTTACERNAAEAREDGATVTAERVACYGRPSTFSGDLCSHYHEHEQPVPYYGFH